MRVLNFVLLMIIFVGGPIFASEISEIQKANASFPDFNICSPLSFNERNSCLQRQSFLMEPSETPPKLIESFWIPKIQINDQIPIDENGSNQLYSKFRSYTFSVTRLASDATETAFAIPLVEYKFLRGAEHPSYFYSGRPEFTLLFPVFDDPFAWKVGVGIRIPFLTGFYKEADYFKVWQFSARSKLKFEFKQSWEFKLESGVFYNSEYNREDVLYDEYDPSKPNSGQGTFKSNVFTQYPILTTNHLSLQKNFSHAHIRSGFLAAYSFLGRTILAPGRSGQKEVIESIPMSLTKVDFAIGVSVGRFEAEIGINRALVYKNIDYTTHFDDPTFGAFEVLTFSVLGSF